MLMSFGSNKTTEDLILSLLEQSTGSQAARARCLSFWTRGAKRGQDAHKAAIARFDQPCF